MDYLSGSGRKAIFIESPTRKHSGRPGTGSTFTFSRPPHQPFSSAFNAAPASVSLSAWGKLGKNSLLSLWFLLFTRHNGIQFHPFKEKPRQITTYLPVSRLSRWSRLTMPSESLKPFVSPIGAHGTFSFMHPAGLLLVIRADPHMSQPGNRERLLWKWILCSWKPLPLFVDFLSLLLSYWKNLLLTPNSLICWNWCW